MKRREFLLGISSIGTVGLAGCMGFGDSDEDDPRKPVREYVLARDTVDVERANELIHSDAPQGRVTNVDGELWESLSFEIDMVQVVEQDEENGTAIVRVLIIVSSEKEEDVNSQVVSEEWEVRKQNGEWKLWELKEE